jgi:hypothetical protein
MCFSPPPAAITGMPGGAQGIEAEIPEELRSNFEELERKARFLRARHAKMRHEKN